MTARQSPTVAFTVDVEPDCPPFLRGFRGVEHGMPRLLDLLAARGIPATLFTTGDVAARYPATVERGVSEGHELACHGMTHTAFPDLSERAAQDEIEQSAAILRRFAPVTSFRAPYLRFPPSYLPMLQRSGFTLDSSQAIYKLAYRREHRRPTEARVARVPASVTSSVLRLPRLVRGAYLAALSDPIVLFVHPWEFVDLRREKLRLDCRFRTGDEALHCVAAVLDRYAARSARFVRMRELLPTTDPRAA
jgi:peptidoglycan/xylan/chitin deacetylase (PgdA/CDA1 family)